MRRSSIFIPGIAALALGLSAAPALASTPSGPSQSGQVNASVTVQQALGVSGFPTAVSWLNPTVSGNPNQAVETPYGIISNDPSGYTLTLTPVSSSFYAPGGSNSELYLVSSASASDQSVDLSDISVQHGTGTPQQFNGHQSGGAAQPITLANGTGLEDGSKQYTDTWDLTIPAALPAATYSAQFTYTLSGK